MTKVVGIKSDEVEGRGRKAHSTHVQRCQKAGQPILGEPDEKLSGLGQKDLL